LSKDKETSKTDKTVAKKTASIAPVRVPELYSPRKKAAKSPRPANKIELVKYLSTGNHQR
jgi:hypothetical protein